MDRIATAEEIGDPIIDESPNDLVHGMGDAACFGGMVGCGETYLPAFAIAVGLGETAAGLVASVPLLVGGILQLVSPVGVRVLGSKRRWVVLSACMQAVTFVPLALSAYQGTITQPALLLIASLYWAAGLSIGPSWNSWMSQLVPAKIRANYFARWTRLQQFCTFCALLSAGLLLQYCDRIEQSLLGFAVIFFFAGTLRLISACFLFRLPETDRYVASEPFNSIASIETAVPTTAKRLLAYLVLMQVCVQLCGPYFVPYMLTQLNFGYGQYVFLISLMYVSKVLSLSLWGKYAARVGAAKLLWFGGIGLVPLSAMWIVSPSLWWLAAVQLISGVAWSAYELGFFLSFFDILPVSQRTKLLTFYNLANTGAICTGALAGWAILSHFGCETTTYYSLFATSTVGRFLCLSILIGIALPNRNVRSIVMRILSVRPGAGSVVTPVVASQANLERERPNS